MKCKQKQEKYKKLKIDGKYSFKKMKGSGSSRRTRTADPVVNSHLLYRLSYRGTTPLLQQIFIGYARLFFSNLTLYHKNEPKKASNECCPMLSYDFLYKNLEALHESFLLSATSTTDILEKAIEIEHFIVQLFELKTTHNNPYNELLIFKRRFIQRYALKKFPHQVTPVRNPIPGDDFIFMQTVLKWEEEGKQDLIDQAAQYASFVHQDNSIKNSSITKI